MSHTVKGVCDGCDSWGTAGWPEPVWDGEANCNLRLERGVGVGSWPDPDSPVWEGISGSGGRGWETSGRERLVVQQAADGMGEERGWGGLRRWR